MTTDRQQEQFSENKQPIPFGARLKSAREAMGFERKDAALKLRLSEKVILMMERDRYPNDLPVTFIRGYLRAYAKLLDIPEYEVKKAIEPIKAKINNNGYSPALKNIEIASNTNYYMHIFTLVIIVTLIGLVSMWWRTHNSSSQEMIEPVATIEETTTPPAPPESKNESSTPSAVLAEPPASAENTQETPPKAAATPSSPTNIADKHDKFTDTNKETENNSDESDVDDR